MQKFTTQKFSNEKKLAVSRYKLSGINFSALISTVMCSGNFSQLRLIHVLPSVL